MGVNLTKALDAQTIRTLDEIQKNGDESMKIPMRTEPMPVLFILFAGVFAAALSRSSLRWERLR